MTDRKPTYPRRVTITREDGSKETVTWEYADNPITEGTPLSKANLLDDTNAQLILPGVEDPTVNQALGALGKKARALGSVSVTLPASGWQGSTAPYTQQIAVEGMTAEWNPGTPVAVPGTLDNDGLIALQEALGALGAIESKEGSLLFTCPEEKPSVNMTLRVPGI